MSGVVFRIPQILCVIDSAVAVRLDRMGPLTVNLKMRLAWEPRWKQKFA
jgi:hypothetical protein